MSNIRRLSSMSDLNVVFGSVLAMEPQGSHKAMAKSILNPIWSNFELKLTPVKISKDEFSCKIKKNLPQGYAAKKLASLPWLEIPGHYREFYISRIPGQTISIYPEDESLINHDDVNPIYVSPERQVEQGDRRKSSIIKFKIVIPQGWSATAYEVSSASEKKLTGKDIANSAHKIYQELTQGACTSESIEALINKFLNEYHPEYSGNSADISMINSNNFMPQHRMLFMNLMLLKKLKEKI